VELGGVGAAGVPPLAQVGGVPVQDAALPPGAVVHQQFLGAGSPREAADCAPGQAQLPRDLRLAAAFGQQAVHVSVPGPGPAGGPSGSRQGRECWLAGRRGRRVLLGLDRGGQVPAVPADRPLDRLGEVVPQVPAVGYLDCLRLLAGGAV
jgi:hypothetical protein